MSARVIHGKCEEVLPTLLADSVDSVVTDPPYNLGFLGKAWDRTGIAFDPALWRETLRVLKPGGHLLAFGGTRTSHRLTCAIEDAGFEIRDSIAWLYGTGFPKAKGQLKPAFEPIVVARKRSRETGVGRLQTEACRIETTDSTVRRNRAEMGYHGGNLATEYQTGSDDGRWPANVVLDELTSASLDAARFFYVAKAGKRERITVDGIAHPTVKPLTLMRWLVRLVTPPDGILLDPFAGSGTTLEAAQLENLSAIGIENDATYLPLIHERLNR